MVEYKTRTQALTEIEMKKLKRDAIIVWIVGCFILLIGAYFFTDGFITLRSRPTPILIIASFFTLFALIIFYINSKDAFRKEALIYTGKITGKRTNTDKSMQNKRSFSYFISIGEKSFKVALADFEKLHVEDTVDIFTFPTDRVYKIEKSEFVTSSSANDKRHNYSTSFDQDIAENFSADEKAIVLKSFIDALRMRAILGSVVCFVIYAILAIIVILFEKPPVNSGVINLILYALTAIFSLIVILINRRTFNLFRDVIFGVKITSIEPIKDLIRSTEDFSTTTVSEEGKNISSGDKFYLQVNSSLISTDEDTFSNAAIGKSLEIQRTKYAKQILKHSLRK